MLQVLIMVIIRFDDEDAERRALGWLAGRFSFKSWENGDLMLHEQVLPNLALEGIPFKVQCPASYECSLPSIRNSSAATV